MNTQIYKNCAYYFQHYILNRSQLCRIYCGHCAHVKPKTKKPNVPVCQYHAPKPSDAEIYATKEYLTKELLNYVLSMELLPEILDAPIEANMDTTHP